MPLAEHDVIMLSIATRSTLLSQNVGTNNEKVKFVIFYVSASSMSAGSVLFSCVYHDSILSVSQLSCSATAAVVTRNL